ncbi:hypothetical protein [Lysobacter capsici]|uniref:hypothetical protein n=1 Tax=Lysobacter capsici TaxID=435897 RepID=UPI001C005D48|nr:hypothetical protein [Lysobacter capsici]QWF15116.1 hypothetical protein KME82_15040 [Lysobacter capsici]
MLEIPACMEGINCGDLGTWLSSIASFAAVVAALYLARRSEKPRAKGDLNIVIFTPDLDRAFLCYRVSNLGTHSLRINSAFLEIHPIVRRFVKWPSAVANNWQHPTNSRLPTDLQRGETFSYAAPEGNVFGQFLSEFPGPPWLVARLVRAGVTTPWGSIYVKISRDVRKSLRDEIIVIRRKIQEDRS